MSTSRLAHPEVGVPKTSTANNTRPLVNTVEDTGISFKTTQLFSCLNVSFVTCKKKSTINSSFCSVFIHLKFLLCWNHIICTGCGNFRKPKPIQIPNQNRRSKIIQQKIYKIKMSAYMLCVQYIYLYMTWGSAMYVQFFFFFLNA